MHATSKMPSASARETSARSDLDELVDESTEAVGEALGGRRERLLSAGGDGGVASGFGFVFSEVVLSL